MGTNTAVVQTHTARNNICERRTARREGYRDAQTFEKISIFTPIFVIIYRYAGMFRDLLKVLLFLRPLMSVGWSVGLSVISRKNGKLQFHAPSGAHVST